MNIIEMDQVKTDADNLDLLTHSHLLADNKAAVDSLYLNADSQSKKVISFREPVA